MGNLTRQWGRVSSRAVGRWGHPPPQHVPHQATYLHLHFFTNAPKRREQQCCPHSRSPCNFLHGLPHTGKLKPAHPSSPVSSGLLASTSKGKAQALFPEENPVMTGLVRGLPHSLPLYGVCYHPRHTPHHWRNPKGPKLPDKRLTHLLRVQLILFSGSPVGKRCSALKRWVRVLQNLERLSALAKPTLTHFLSAWLSDTRNYRLTTMASVRGNDLMDSVREKLYIQPTFAGTP